MEIKNNTIGDRIRGMSDEELADYLNAVFITGKAYSRCMREIHQTTFKGAHRPAKNTAGTLADLMFPQKDFLSYLKQEYKED